MVNDYNEWLYYGPSLDVLGAGIECVAFDYSKRMVLKTYRHKSERDRAFLNQKKARQQGIAPPTLGKLDYKPKEKGACMRYGYLSARAEIFWYDEKDESTCPISDMQHKKLAKKMRKLGFSSNDLHDENIGLYKGMWVVIDFGDASIIY